MSMTAPPPVSLTVSLTVILTVLAMVFLPMAVEALRAARNERIQRQHGGLEPPDDVYGWMRIAYPGAFLLMAAEALVRWRLSAGGAAGVWSGLAALQITGLLVFTLAKLLKWWAILSLGRFWTFRVIVIPGSRLVASGPYRFLTHPNYVGVIGELVGVALMLGAALTGPLATGGFGWLIARRVQVERAALARFVREQA